MRIVFIGTELAPVKITTFSFAWEIYPRSCITYSFTMYNSNQILYLPRCYSLKYLQVANSQSGPGHIFRKIVIFDLTNRIKNVMKSICNLCSAKMKILNTSILFRIRDSYSTNGNLFSLLLYILMHLIRFRL